MDLALPRPTRERTDVGAHMYLVPRRPSSARERGQLALGRPVADDQAAAAIAQPRVELGQALEQELRTRLPEAWQAAEQSDRRGQNTGTTTSAEFEYSPQGGVVMQAQVAPEPDQGDAERHRPVSTSSSAGPSSGWRKV